jgi:hypothetical protein
MKVLNLFSFGIIIFSTVFLFAFPNYAENIHKLSTMDYTRPIEHQELEEYVGPSTCAQCHEDAIDEIMSSSHYTWKGKFKNGGTYSKLQMTAVPINWLGVLNKEKHVRGGCGFCHIGGGAMPVDPAKATEEEKDKLDCLICHATTYDTSVRFPKQVNGEWILPQDRSLEAARSVGKPTQDNCLRCHYIALWNYKRGADMKDDIHYRSNMSCTKCHRVRNHRFPGFGPTITPEVSKRVQCTDCHSQSPHYSKTLNKHVRIDCRTCHIVTAGGVIYKNAAKDGIFVKEKGIYVAEEKTAVMRPVYFWYDGVSRGAVPKGSIDDLSSKIQPFKKYTGVAPMDKNTGDFLWLKLGVFAKTGNLKKAIRVGAEESGRRYSGAWKPNEYDVYFQLSHGVTLERSLQCNDCHSPSGLLDFKALGYSEEKAKELSQKR